MAIDVDLASLRRSRNTFRNEVRFELRGDFALPPDLEFLQERTARIDSKMLETENPVRHSQWVQTRSGWSGVLLNCDDFDDALAWLERFASLDWSYVNDGRILGGQRSRGPGIGTLPPTPTALVAYRTADVPTLPVEKRGSWLVEGKITRYIAEQAQAWTYTRAGAQYLTRDADWQLEVTGLDNHHAIAQAIEHYAACQVSGVEQQPTRLRQATYWAQGKAVYQVCDQTRDWSNHIDLLRRVLVWAPPHTDYGTVRMLPGNLQIWPNEPGTWPFITASELYHNGPLLKSMVPDVSGLQLLTDAHLERAHDLSDWTITSLAGGRHLVEAVNLGDWYTDPLPQGLLSKAREDFGSMILTSEFIKTNSPWPEGVRSQARPE